MRTISLALLSAGAVALLAACDSDTQATGPAVQPQTTVNSSAKVYRQLDRLANPLVSEVTVVKARHHLYNIGQPQNDVATFTGDVSTFVTGTAGRDAAYASAIAGALLPDMLLIYPKRDGQPVFWLSWVFGGYGGRTLSDDVVDIGLGAIFGTLLGNTNNVTPGLTTDNVPSNDKAFGTTFPYLAAAN
ncbi:MAG: DUF4331 family protein [Cytophagaceae bacterium]|nr:DUF4331 family protein [Gemmatimonadaceae bacterium]